MKLEILIKKKYGSIVAMLKQTNSIKKCYLYNIMKGKQTNPTKKIIQELARLLDISVGEVIDILDAIEDEKK